jgi:GTP diphosphokinase / guanosine-3',5'-bis(diphosphate) 3'-diphosphatase
MLADLVEKIRAYHPSADVEIVSRAYKYSRKAHEGQKRKSGEPFFVHPASVANIITDLKLDTASVCAGLLHDAVEDTLATVEDIEKEFGSEIAFLVDGVTKLSKINFTSKEDRQAENFRKMVVAMARDIRVLLVKLCDRLDNMRTLDFMSSEAQERIARETMDIYAPLANRLGIAGFKDELEDLAFRYLDLPAYQELVMKLGKAQPERERYIATVNKMLAAKLAEQGFSAEVTGRAKHVYSILRKMKTQKCDFEQLFDIVAFRVIVESVADCYATLGVIHSQWTPVPGRFKDYIALPKPNMYQSLHTSVIGPDRERIEIQIRTHDMHRVAEKGIAAHWKYKERISGGIDPEDAEQFTWLHQLMESHKEMQDPAEFLESVKVDLFADEVYVFTPKGDVRVFPRGATPVDFAYAIHSHVGSHCTGARVNGAIVPLRYKLRNGDVVDVMTSNQQHPSKDWLDFVVSGRAKNKVRAFMRTEQRERSLKLGRELLEKALHARGVSLQRFLKSHEDVRRVREAAKVQSEEELFANIGYGKIAADAIAKLLAPADGAKDSQPPPDLREGRIESIVRRVTGKATGGIKLNGIDDVLVRYAKCCSPLPGDQIIGFITRGRGVTVHRRTCQRAFETDPERRVDVSWDSKAKINRPVQLRVKAANRPGMLATVGQAFQGKGINIEEASVRSCEDGSAISVFTFNCGDLAQLKTMIRVIQKVDGVVQVERL